MAAAIPGLFFNYLILFQFGYFIYWMIKKDRLAFVSLAVFLLFAPYLKRTISFYPVGSSGGKDVFRIATYNIFGLKKLRLAAEKEGDAPLEKHRSDWNDMPEPDVLCIQEANGYVQKLLDQILDYPHAHKFPSRDQVILSKHRFLDKGEVKLPSKSGDCYWVDIKAQGRHLRVYCVHLESNRVSLEFGRLLKEGNIQERSSWKNAFQLFGRYMKSAGDRAGEVKVIRDHIQESPYPVLLAGDLNDTPVSYTYQQLRQELKDTFIKNTRGISSTYRGIIPFLRIDYIFADKRCEVRNYHVPRWPWSDHYPIFAEIALDSLSKEN